MAKVSVIVPNYNHAPYLKQRLDSIYQQTYQDFEVILLDDCSRDGSREILQSYADMMPNTTFAPNQSNSGSVFRQWRKGVELSQGEYIWIAESDDYASSFFLKRLVEIMERWPNVGLAYTQSWMVDVQGNILSDANCWENDFNNQRWHNDFINSGRDEIVEYLTVKNTIPNASAVLIRKKALEASGGIITHPFRLCGDWLQWIKILAQSDIAFVSDALNFWRQKSSNARIANAGTLEWIEGEQVLSQGCDLLSLPEAQTNKILLHFLKQCWQWQKDYIDQLS